MRKNRVKMSVLWKSLWKMLWRGAGFFVHKAVENKKSACSVCSVLWESVRFCGNLFGFCEKVLNACGKSYLGRIVKFSELFIFSTYHTTMITKYIFIKGSF